MPGILYRFGAGVLRLGTRLAAVFHPKARARTRGAAGALDHLPATAPGRDCYWMHCASVGEFEQGRPVWERIRELHPDARFVLTFYSPSGMEFYSGRSDLGEVRYLPDDRRSAMEAFVGRLTPKLVLLVKYEWWLGLHAVLRARGIPAVVFSVAFRQNQPFFRRRHPLHSDYREALAGVAAVAVQSPASLRLLRAHDYATPALVAGDTRLDRVLEIADDARPDAVIEAWLARGPGPVLVAGSTWPPDEEGLGALLRARPDYRVVVAAHEVSEAATQRLRRAFAFAGVALYTEYGRRAEGADGLPRPRVLALDVRGVLAKAYRYAWVAYVGGGFGAGIHNVLEAAVYACPVAFGPRHGRFDEALDLVDAGVATPLRRPRDLVNFAARYDDEPARSTAAAAARAYVRERRGATALIIEMLAAREWI